MTKAKKVLIAVLIGVLAYPILINLTQKTDIYYFPFVEPIKGVPVLLLMIVCFLAGGLATLVTMWVRGAKKKPNEK